MGAMGVRRKLHPLMMRAVSRMQETRSVQATGASHHMPALAESVIAADLQHARAQADMEELLALERVARHHKRKLLNARKKTKEETMKIATLPPVTVLARTMSGSEAMLEVLPRNRVGNALTPLATQLGRDSKQIELHFGNELLEPQTQWGHAGIVSDGATVYVLDSDHSPGIRKPAQKRTEGSASTPRVPPPPVPTQKSQKLAQKGLMGAAVTPKAITPKAPRAPLLHQELRKRSERMTKTE